MIERSVRQGQRPGVDVRERAIDVAETLFGSDGIDAVSLRQVAREVGVAPMAVTHHFHDKDGLLMAVITRRGGDLSRAATRRLERLVEQPETPTPRELAEALLAPYGELLNADPRGGLAWLKVLHALGTANHEVWLAALESDAGMVPSFLAALDRTLPDLGATQRSTLASVTMYSMLGVLSGTDQAGFGAPLSDDGLDPSFAETLTRFVASALEGFNSQDPGAQPSADVAR